MMFESRSTIWRGVVPLLLLSGLTGCGSQPGAKSHYGKTEATPNAVTTVQPKRQSLRRNVEQPGVVMAYEEAQLFGRVPGYVGKIHVDIGQSVIGPKFDGKGIESSPGQLLAEISVPEIEEEVHQKKAYVLQAKAEVEQAKRALAASEASIATAAASVVEAKALGERWESESKRVQGLVASGVVDAQTHDETLNQFKAAKARVQSTEAAEIKAKADRDKAIADVATAESRVVVAEADARRVAAQLAYAKIRAPFDGVVTRRKVNVGDLVQPSAGKAEPLFAIARLDPVRIVIAIPEADAAFIRDKGDVSLRIPALAEPHLKGTVTRTSWALEPGSRTLRAEVELPNADGRLRPGMYVTAQINSALPEAWTLPTAALVKQGDTMFCFRVEEGKAIRTNVRIGRTEGAFTEVSGWQTASSPPALSPLTGSETIIANPAGIVDGQAINLAKSK